MSTDIEPAVSTELAIAGDQTRFTEAQVAMLRQIGVEDASDADLAVFFHHCKRTGLDPFARQIYMIGRNTEVSVRVDLGDGASRVEKRRVMKYTIQTGIDGYRLIGKRAAARENALVSHDPPAWVGKDDVWRDYWNPANGTPVAARYTIRVNGAPYTATCMFAEFAQYTGGGELTSMWKKMPANQLAKCAEAAAWRKAFPSDFADIHESSSWQVIDEDTPTPVPAPAAPRRLTEADILHPDTTNAGAARPYIGREGFVHAEKPGQASGLDRVQQRAARPRRVETVQLPEDEPSEPAGSRQTAPTTAGSAARQDQDPRPTPADSPDLRDPAPAAPEPPASRTQNIKINDLFDGLGLPKSHREDRLTVISHILGYKVDPKTALTSGEALKVTEKLLDWQADEQTPVGDRVRDILNTATLRAEAEAAYDEGDA